MRQSQPDLNTRPLHKARILEIIMNSFIRPFKKRILIVTGHYGSGKTEFAVSFALLTARMRDRPYPRLALVDLDIANPYFRSRERRELLEEAGIGVYGSVYKTEITAELPALSANIRTPLEDEGCFVIVDAGGNDSGALVLNQFGKYFTPEQAAVAAVINANRPETRDADGAVRHLSAIEGVTGLRIEGIINNTHLLRQTTPETIIGGHALCAAVCDRTGKELWCDCYPEPLVKKEALAGVSDYLMPLGLYMRPTWLDR
jgi:energy-coupling factor transporter ATP-binding protein EcfA2